MQCENVIFSKYFIILLNIFKYILNIIGKPKYVLNFASINDLRRRITPNCIFIVI